MTKNTVGMEQPELIRLWTSCKTLRLRISQPSAVVVEAGSSDFKNSVLSRGSSQKGK